MDNQQPPQLLDPVNNLTLKPGDPGDPFVDNFPRELIGTSAGKLYLYLREFATGREGELLSLPERRELARSVGISINTLISAEKFLHERGWIQITNFKAKGERTQRRRIIVKQWIHKLTREMVANEIYQIMQRGINQTLGLAVDGLHNMYLPSSAQPVGEPQEPRSNSNISQILRSCRKADRRGQTLAHFNEQTILAVCHDASQSDIATAILEVERYNGKPSDILKLFAARFKDGKLNPERKGSFRVHAKSDASGNVVHTITPSATSIPVAISHDEFHSPATVDALCTSLNAREVIERGKLPVNALNTNTEIFVVDEDLGNPYVKLASNVTLVRITAGKWGIKWQRQSTRGGSNKREAQTVSVAERLASGALSSSIKA